MNRRRACAGLICVLQGAAANGQLAGGSPRPGQAIEFSDPKPQTAVTNVSRMSREVNATGDEEARAELPQSRAIPDNSLQAILPSPPPFIAPSPVIVRDRRARDWLDPNADWTSLSSEDDMLRQFALKNILGGLNGDPGNNERGRSREMTQTVYERMLDNRAGRLPGAAGSSYSYTDPSTRSSTEKPGQPSDMLATTPSASQILGIDRNPALAGTGARPESLAEILGLNTPSGWNNSSGWSAPGLDPKPDAQGRGAPVDTYQNLLNGIYETRPALTPQEAPRPSSPWYGGSAADTATANAMNPYATLPGSTVNPALLPPSSPRSPIPASLMPAPYNPGPPPVNNNLLLRSQGFEATRRPF